MDDDRARGVADQVAGRTVAHRSPFERLEVPNRREHPRHLVEHWIRPLYVAAVESPEHIDAYRGRRAEVSVALADELLSYRDWRPKLVGAHIAAIERYVELQERIGRLLLRSDVCCCGRAYCLALARFGGSEPVELLRTYLAHYLEQPDLWFDQGHAMAALAHLDVREGTLHARDFDERWKRFIANKPAWDLAQITQRFETSMAAIAALGV